MAASFAVNTRENARRTFDHKVREHVQDMIDTNFKFFKQINDKPEFADFLNDLLFDRYAERKTTTLESVEDAPERRTGDKTVKSFNGDGPVLAFSASTTGIYIWEKADWLFHRDATGRADAAWNGSQFQQVGDTLYFK